MFQIYYIEDDFLVLRESRGFIKLLLYALKSLQRPITFFMSWLLRHTGMTLHTYCRTIKEAKNDKMTFKGHKAAILTAFLSKTPKFGYNKYFQVKFWHLIPIGGG